MAAEGSQLVAEDSQLVLVAGGNPLVAGGSPLVAGGTQLVEDMLASLEWLRKGVVGLGACNPQQQDRRGRWIESRQLYTQ